MSPQTKRTLYRLLSVFLAAGAGDALIQFSVSATYDWRHLAGALVAAGVVAAEKYLSEQDSSVAAPTVRAVDTALQNNAASVPPPTIAIPPNPPTIVR